MTNMAAQHTSSTMTPREIVQRLQALESAAKEGAQRFCSSGNFQARSRCEPSGAADEKLQ